MEGNVFNSSGLQAVRRRSQIAESVSSSAAEGKFLSRTGQPIAIFSPDLLSPF